MNLLSKTTKETTYDIRLTETELKIIWHRLNISDAGFRREYVGCDTIHGDDSYDDLTNGGINATYYLWKAIDDILWKENDDIL